MKEYALYDVKDYEQLVFMGTIREIANYLDYEVGTLRSFLTRKKNRKQDLLQHKYDLVEIDKEIKDIEEKTKSNKYCFEVLLKEFRLQTHIYKTRIKKV